MTRKRASITNFGKAGTTGGGGGPSPGGTINWGPNFGEEVEALANVAASLSSLDLSGSTSASVAASFNSFDPTYAQHTTSAAADLVSVDLTGDTTCNAAATLTQVNASYALHTTNAAADLVSVDLQGSTTCNAAADLAAVDLNGSTTATGSVGDYKVVVDEYLATQDSWVATDGTCTLDNTNHDGEDLNCRGGAAPREIYLSWDLSGLPSNATVTQASVTFTLETAPSVTNSQWRAALTTTAGASWDETTITCSNRPSRGSDASDSNLTWTTTDSPGDTQSTVLNSTGRSRVASQMGSGDFNLIMYVNSGVATANAIVESKDEGTNDSAGPTLRLKFTVPK